MAAEYTGKTAEKPLSYIYSGELPKCGKSEAKKYLENIISRLQTKHNAEKMHGSTERAAYLEKIILELEETVNGMHTDR